MATYDVEVVVHLNYEVEAKSEEEAEELGWHWEDYVHFSEVYSINVTQTSEDDEQTKQTFS